MFIIDIMMAISNWLWGWPLLILTSAVAVYLSVRLSSSNSPGSDTP